MCESSQRSQRQNDGQSDCAANALFVPFGLHYLSLECSAVGRIVRAHQFSDEFILLLALAHKSTSGSIVCLMCHLISSTPFVEDAGWSVRPIAKDGWGR